MKTATFVFLSLLIIPNYSCFYSSDWDSGVTGNGEVVTKTIEVDGFTGVHASSGIDVEISQGAFSVELEADENLHEYITIELEGDLLVIDTERNIRKAAKKVVYVSLPELNELNISSAGDIVGKTEFECDNLDISISSAGDLDLGVTANRIDISISSSGDCDLYGHTEYLDARLSSAGDLNACDMEADYVDVKVSSAGDACVFANKELKMEASSAGNIYYMGDAVVVKSHRSSAGNIKKKN
jgi:hypothetical protein